MDPRTASKIKLFGTGKAMQAKMAELFSKEQIPSLVGGEKSFQEWQEKWNNEMDQLDLTEYDKELKERKPIEILDTETVFLLLFKRKHWTVSNTHRYPHMLYFTLLVFELLKIIIKIYGVD